MIGIEEEFFVVDEESLFLSSYAPKLILDMFTKDSRYLTKSTMESPLDKELLKAGFPVIELKTSPHNEVDSLWEELRFHRKMLKEVAEENHMLIVPTGLYPTHDPERDSRLLCCAIHVHISGYPLRKSFFSLVEHIPELIAVTANSPFLIGKVFGKTMRTLYSYAIGIPTHFYKRTSDVIINQRLKTVELRVCDTQVISNDVFKLVHLILGIVDSHCKAYTPRRRLNPDLNKKRLMASTNGKFALEEELRELYNEIRPSISEFGTEKIIYEYLMEETCPADFQIGIADKFGLSGVIDSLWSSFREDTLKSSNTAVKVRRGHTLRLKNFPHVFLYLPIHFVNLSRKFFQDDVIRTWILMRHTMQARAKNM